MGNSEGPATGREIELAVSGVQEPAAERTVLRVGCRHMRLGRQSHLLLGADLGVPYQAGVLRDHTL